MEGVLHEYEPNKVAAVVLFQWRPGATKDGKGELLELGSESPHRMFGCKLWFVHGLLSQAEERLGQNDTKTHYRSQAAKGVRNEQAPQDHDAD